MNKKENKKTETSITVSFNGCQMTIEDHAEITATELRAYAISDENVAEIEETWTVSVREEDGRFRELEDEEIVVLVEDQEFSCVNDDLAS